MIKYSLSALALGLALNPATSAGMDNSVLSVVDVALNKVCKPVIFENKSFDAALKAIERPIQDTSNENEKSSFIYIDDTNGVFVSQSRSNAHNCAILFGVPSAGDVKLAVNHVLATWGCDADTKPVSSGNSLTYSCGETTVKLISFEAEDEIALSFRFN